MSASVALPGIILLLAFFLKLAIDREVDIPNSVYALLELPVDVLFLSTSFIAAYTISAAPPDNQTGFIYFGSYLLVAAIVVFCWRKACKLFESGHHGWMFTLSTVNYILSAACLVRSIQLV